jgi:hypothetical protein
LGASLRLRLDSLLRCTIVVENLTDERVVTINGKLIEIALFFDHDINDEDTRPIQAHLSVLFTTSMFGIMSHTHGLVLHRIGDEFG